MKLAVVTGSEVRHRYIAFALSQYCHSFFAVLEEPVSQAGVHFQKRLQVEEELLGLGSDEEKALETSAIHCERGELNHCPSLISRLVAFKPDVAFFYGCSIISANTISLLKCPLINVHLGLSPYYRGAGTNFWPFYNGEPEFVGVTYHALTERVDDGQIFLQRRAEPTEASNVHEYGMQLIRDIPSDLFFLLDKQIPFQTQTADPRYPNTPRNYYKRSDFTEEIGAATSNRFQDLLQEYRANREARNLAAPIKCRAFYL